MCASKILFTVVAVLCINATQALADVPKCQPVTKCEGLWVAAHDVGVKNSFFSINSQTVAADSLHQGSAVRANRDIFVHNSPAGWGETPYVLQDGTPFRIKAIQSVPLPAGGVQIWVQISATAASAPGTPGTPAPPTPAPPTPASAANGPCFDLPSGPPSAPLPIVSPPASQPPTTNDVARLLEGRDMMCDQWGLIVHQDSSGAFNGGDTAQREGWYWLGVWIRENTSGLTPWPHKRKLKFEEVLALLEPNSDGVFYRHPKQAPFNNPFDKKWGFSRDQMVPLVAALGVRGRTDVIKRLWDALPEDLLGKHSFNGNWRNFLGQDGWNCSEIEKIGCDATADCSLKVDNRACDAQVDTRDCSLKQDTRDCSQPHDERSCSTCILRNIFTGGCSQMGNDPFCEASKAAQNEIYAGNKATCEIGKAGQNKIYEAEKLACESGKEAQNTAYAAAKLSCESQKAGQNGIYGVQKALCETAKTSGKAACEFEKSTKKTLCFASNYHSGDFISPATVNLFIRALGGNPLTDMHLLPLLNVPSGLAGEIELLANQSIVGRDVKVDLGGVQATPNPDNVGDDLNNMVLLIMAKLRSGTPISATAMSQYVSTRPHTYGSYLRTFYQVHGDQMAHVKEDIVAGIAQGWQPDVSAPLGAARWYHRPSEGANPQLATLWAPIIAYYFK